MAPSEAVADVLRRGWTYIASQIRTRAVPMIQAWAVRAVQDYELRLACGLYAHLVLLHSHRSTLDVATVSTLLSAQV